MTHKPILTVAIPTYNRCSSLEKIIKQLQLQQEDGQFLILISDDGSTDNTEKMVISYQNKIPNLVYHKNIENLGFSGNLIKLYELTQTRYLWFLSDDETVLPEAINKILLILEKYKPTVVLFSHSWTDAYDRNLNYGVNGGLIYDNLDTFNDYLKIYKSIFLSILVVEKSIPIVFLKKNCLNNNIFFQVSLVLTLLSHRFRLYESSSAIVRRNHGYRFGEFFKYFFTDQLDAVYLIDHKFTNSQFLKVSKGQIFSNLKLYLSQKLGLYKSYGSPTKETIIKIIRYYGLTSIIIFLFPVFYFIIPSIIIKIIYFAILLKLYGYKKAVKIYRNNINRALESKVFAGFMKYR